MRVALRAWRFRRTQSCLDGSVATRSYAKPSWRDKSATVASVGAIPSVSRRRHESVGVLRWVREAYEHNGEFRHTPFTGKRQPPSHTTPGRHRLLHLRALPRYSRLLARHHTDGAHQAVRPCRSTTPPHCWERAHVRDHMPEPLHPCGPAQSTQPLCFARSKARGIEIQCLLIASQRLCVALLCALHHAVVSPNPRVCSIKRKRRLEFPSRLLKLPQVTEYSTAQ
jgi:hypothetical protein